MREYTVAIWDNGNMRTVSVQVDPRIAERMLEVVYRFKKEHDLEPTCLILSPKAFLQFEYWCIENLRNDVRCGENSELDCYQFMGYNVFCGDTTKFITVGMPARLAAFILAREQRL